MDKDIEMKEELNYVFITTWKGRWEMYNRI